MPQAATAETPFGVTFQAALANSTDDAHRVGEDPTLAPDSSGESQPQNARTPLDFASALGEQARSVGGDATSDRSDVAAQIEGTAAIDPRSANTALPLNFTSPVAFGAVPYVPPATSWTGAAVQAKTQGTLEQTPSVSTTVTTAPPRISWSDTILPATIAAPAQVPSQPAASADAAPSTAAATASAATDHVSPTAPSSSDMPVRSAVYSCARSASARDLRSSRDLDRKPPLIGDLG
jgi:hypothetical protein